jgi:maltose O-acetyltransferase
MQKILDFISFLFHTIKGDALWVMKRRGLKVGRNFVLAGSYIDLRFLHLITMGDNVSLSKNTILAHDASMNLWLGHSRIGKVVIGNRVFVGYGSIILPGVTIGDDVVIGAGSVVTHDIPSRSVAKGNPAVVTGTIDEFLARKKKEMEIYPIFDVRYPKRNKKKRDEQVAKIKNKFGYSV